MPLLGYLQGMQATLEQQRARQQMAQVAQLMNARAHQMGQDAAFGQYLNSAYPNSPVGSPTPAAGVQSFPVPSHPITPQPLMPGTASQPVVPPYRTVASASQAPVAPAQAPASPPPIQPPPIQPPSSIAGARPTLPQIVENLRRAGVPQDQWMNVINEISKSANMDFLNQYRMALLGDRRVDQHLRQEGLDAANSQRAISNAYKERKLQFDIYKANTARPASQEAVNTFVSQFRSDLAPVQKGLRQGQEILSLLSSGSPASTAQIQKALTDYVSTARTTNRTYADNKNFGNFYERPINALSRFFTGELTDANKAMIAQLVKKMDSGVYQPMRKKIMSAYSARAKSQGINSSIVDDMGNLYDLPESSAKSSDAQLPEGLPQGSKLSGAATKDGRPVWVSPDGKQWTVEK